MALIAQIGDSYGGQSSGQLCVSAMPSSLIVLITCADDLLVATDYREIHLMIGLKMGSWMAFDCLIFLR